MQFVNSYLDLGEVFYQRTFPVPVESPALFLWNSPLADELLIPQPLQNDVSALARIFSGNEPLAGSEPVALAYAGHQFGNFVPQLGDGRAHLLGEVLDKTGGRFDIQLKGSGPTHFSRGGDGRCALGPAIREYIMSEAMAALGVPTSRCLAVVTTGEDVYRDIVLSGAVVTRVASSHLRVGSFEYFSAQENSEALQNLLDYSIERHYPAINNQEGNRIVLFLEHVFEKQIKLIVEWMRVGFIHGVMNTDNTTISGDTIDYGPCAMMGHYDPQTVFSSIDRYGRYAYGNQPNIAKWNMGQLAQSLMLLVKPDDSKTIESVRSLYAGFAEKFERAYTKMLSQKFGLDSSHPDTVKFMHEFLEHMKLSQMDFTQTFDKLTRSLEAEEPVLELKTELKGFYDSWRDKITNQKNEPEDIYKRMRQANPVVIPRNHHIEAVLKTCQDTGSPDSALKILKVLKSPYKEIPGTSDYQDTPIDKDRSHQTFCGT